MSPVGMIVLLVTTVGFFAWTMRRRWRLLMIGRDENRFDQIGRRIQLTILFAFGQARMPRYRWAGIAHIIFFAGLFVAMVRAAILIGRGFDADFHLWILRTDQPLGKVFAVCKDTFCLAVITAVGIFFYYRVIKRLPRLTLNFEGLLILAILFSMMAADILYDGAHMARFGEFHEVEYAGFVTGKIMAGWPAGLLTFLEHFGFWTHASLVLIFMNILPYTKQFHEITAIPNVFTMDLTPRGRLAPVDDMEGRIERDEPLGVATIDHLSWKGILDLYTCTECGRCTDNCPAANTGKLLSPKNLTVDLRDHAYSRTNEVMRLARSGGRLEPHPLVTNGLVKPEVLWACTTCRACEEECPVFITYVDKIVDMRRSLVMERAEFPDELQNAFRGLETSGNPWSYPADDRDAWANGLNIPLLSDHSDAQWLFWVGCAGAFDQRARKTTIATARLLQHAGVDFAILGPEETCTGDPARRAGNEYLFQTLAQQNCETLNSYSVKRILTTCPHCYNTLRNEYPDFGGCYEVVHHTDLLFDLVRQGKLDPKHEVAAAVTFHDSCYLGRYNGVYDSPRRILESIPGIRLVEPEATRDRGLCCGAGGAQMFKEEETGEMRINARRTEQLLTCLGDARACNGARVIGSACPFCMRMLTDGLADAEREDVEPLDVAELLCKSVIS